MTKNINFNKILDKNLNKTIINKSVVYSLFINLMLGFMLVNTSNELIAQKSTPKVDMSKRPESLESKDFTFPKFTEKTLSNGLKVFFVEDKEQPTLNLNFVFKGGKLAEKKADVADFMATLLNKGTKKRSALDIAESLDGIGADISASASNDYVNLSVFTLTKHQDNVLEILNDIILNAKFSDDELEKLVPKAIAGLKSDKANIGSLANKMANIALYGENHPYAKLTTEESIKALETDDLKEYFNSYIRPNNGTLAVIGDFDIDKLTKKLETAFKDWKKGEIPTYTIPQPKSLPTGVYFVERPASVQSAVRYVTKTVPYNSSEYEALTFASGVIHSGFAGRLFRTLREKYSYTYSPIGGQTGNVGVNKFYCGSDVRTNVTDSSISVILNEVGNLASETPSVEEVDLIKKFRIGMYFMSFENASFTANLLQNYDLNGKSLELLKTIHKRYQSLSNYELHKVANQYMNPSNAFIVVVGDKSIKESLKKFGNIYDYDLDLKPVVANEKIDMSPKELIKNYTNAIGGKEALETVKSIKGTGVATLMFNGQEMPGKFEEFKKSPNKMAQTVDLGFDKQLFKFNGTKGFVGSNQGKVDAEGEILKKLAFESLMFAETRLNDFDYKLSVVGKKDGNIVLNVVFGENNERKYYFDEKSFLLKKIEGIEESPQGALNVVKYFDEYVKVGNVMLPKLIKQDLQMVVIKYDYNYELNTEIADEIFD
ncbi:MAG: M16 family metallopeptidase [Candidatus Kapaibacteriota bacterium]|jgi:predicted Zn-dependent peptidase